MFFRKELPMLDDAIERSKQIYTQMGAEWQDQKKTWRFRNGGRLRFRPLERVQDADKYQGQNVTDCCVEEAGQYADSKAIDRLNGVLRSAAGVPTQLILTGNPGGAGQSWIRERYINPAPAGMKVLARQLPRGRVHEYVFIPSKIQNNQRLLQADPDYINRLYMVGSDNLVRAWLDGDWGAVEGAYFDCWSKDMVIKPFAIPANWLRFRSFDWGSARPFSVGWWAVVSETYKGIPKGALVRYREWYGAKSANVGLKMTAEQVSKGIREREPEGEEIAYSVADPAIFAEDGGPSIAERMRPIFWTRADNKRTPGHKQVGGWDQMRQRMIGDDVPMLYTFDTCADSIRTIPVLQHDINKPEDLDTTAEDHCFAAGTLVETSFGPVPIEAMPSTGVVHTEKGEQAYRSARKTRENAEIVRVTFADGRQVLCTPSHRFMLESNQWRYAKNLAGEKVKCEQLPSVTLSKNTMVSGIIGVVDTFNAKGAGFIERCGAMLTEIYQAIATYTTRTMTRAITRLRTWSALHGLNTYLGGTGQSPVIAGGRAFKRHSTRHQYGTGQQKAGHGTRNTMTSTCATSRQQRMYQKLAMFAEMDISQLQPRRAGVNTAIRTAAPAHCVSVEPAGRADVYCLTVPATGSFVIEGGLVVHNCADEWRYACMSRPWIRVVPSGDKPKRDRWDKVFDDDGDADNWRVV